MSRSGDPAIFVTTTDRPTNRQTKPISLPLAQACGGNNRKRVGLGCSWCNAICIWIPVNMLLAESSRYEFRSPPWVGDGRSSTGLVGSHIRQSALLSMQRLRHVWSISSLQVRAFWKRCVCVYVCVCVCVCVCKMWICQNRLLDKFINRYMYTF